MLVLTRRVGEKLIIGDDVIVTILECKGKQARVGIDAPRSVQIVREELLTAAESARRDRAAKSSDR